MAAEDTMEATLRKICRLAVEAITDCDHCGVSVIRHGTMLTASSSSPLVQRLIDVQAEAEEGPALDALREHEAVHVQRFSAERRWPKFTKTATRETGVGSGLVFPLFSVSRPLGVLHLYADTPDAFQGTARLVGSVFAVHVSVALIQARRVEQLEEAIQTRDLIGQAKGILMAQEHLTADQAFDRLREISQRLNRKLRDVAEEVAYTGKLPR